jgi:uncharacterized protein YqeY
MVTAEPDAAEAMRQRLQADLRVAMKQRLVFDVAVLRVLIAALDNAGAVPLSPKSEPRQFEVERRRLRVSDVQDILQAEYEARRAAAGEFGRLGRKPERAQAIREMVIVQHYLSMPIRRGRPLSAQERQALAPYIAAIDLKSAVLHEGKVPCYLPRRFQAVARGNHVYFRAGAYDPSQPSGLALLGHELIHVGQYRGGMTWLSYLWSVRLGYSKSAYERAAVAMQLRILEDLGSVSMKDSAMPPRG